MNTRPALRVLSRARPSLRPIGRRTFLTIIEQGQEGWRLSFGRDPVRLSPGIHLFIPPFHSVQRVDLRECSINIPHLQGYTLDNVPITVTGSLFYRIIDGYKACFKVTDLEKNIQNFGTSAMRAVLGTFSYDQIIGDRNGINSKLNEMIGTSLANWGVEGTRFEVQSFQPANREVERQLELQMEAERNRRKQLLDTQAQINVAEGQKQRVILESEGHLQAKANEADASFKTVVREAEARQQQSLMEASALAAQVEEIAKSIAADKANVKAADRQRALLTLVELRRLEQLKAIAASKSNSTYFFGDKAALGQGGEAYNIDYAEHVKSGMGDRAAGVVV
ncbi:hypothetical protein BDZ89DRAFT_1089923 [Hymenopellis radicata]|nr:hypothetical protein BDZ89DRAFT_1089923 [Hymenopellis radicata]